MSWVDAHMRKKYFPTRMSQGLVGAFAASLLALATPDVAARQGDLQTAIDALYPQDRLAPGDPSERRSCHQVLERTANAEPAVVLAAYTDRANGALRVLRRTGNSGFEPVFDNPPTWALPGTRTRCTIRLDDLDADGRPEVFVAFEGPRASVGWVVRWEGTRLVNLTPTRTVDGRETSLLLNPAVYDLEHRGSLRVIAARDFASPPPGVPAALPAYVYRLGAAALEAESSILAVMGFRADVNPESNLRSFRVITDSSPPYTLRVVNGDRDGRRRVTGATVALNNTPVLGPAQINDGVEFTTATVPALLVQNHITATLSGAPDAFILVLVQDNTRR
jgi:hypothetical protein